MADFLTLPRARRAKGYLQYSHSKRHKSQPEILPKTREERRLEESRERTAHWKRWRPYLSERQWGTVREDYSPNGKPWEYFPHDPARSRAYRWGEDGINNYIVDGQRGAVNPLDVPFRSIARLRPFAYN